MAAVFGTDGAEALIGAAKGADFLWGGDGADAFVFRRNGNDYDWVRDFDPTEGDRIVLQGVNPRTVSLHETGDGVEVWFGGMMTHSTVVVWGVHDLQAVAQAITFA